MLSRDSILWWVVTTWRRRRREYRELFAQGAFAHLEVVVLGSPREADSFLHRIPSRALEACRTQH